MRRRASGTPVYFDRDKLLKHVLEKTGMDQEYTYNDENRGTSQIAYDGQLIDLEDASYRLKRDRARQHYYEWSEDQLPEEQATWDDLETLLNDDAGSAIPFL